MGEMDDLPERATAAGLASTGRWDWMTVRDRARVDGPGPEGG
jgi:hypothetical protein